MNHDRPVPECIDTEQTVLGACCLYDEARQVAIDRLGPEDFFRPAHQTIFQALRQLHETGKPCDRDHLVDLLKRNGDLDRIGGFEYLVQCAEQAPSGAAQDSYCQIVADHAALRGVITACCNAMEQAYSLQPAPETIGGLQDELSRWSAHLDGAPADNEQDLSEALQRAADDCQTPPQGIQTPFPVLNRTLYGLRPGKVTVLGAGPGVGKTSLALRIATDATLQGAGVVYVSCEMSATELAQRCLSMESRIPLSRLVEGRCDDADRAEIDAVRKKYRGKRLHFVCRSLSAGEIEGEVRRQKAHWRAPVDVLVLDYLQLLRGEGRKLYEQVTGLSQAIKQIALKHGVSVLLLSQFERGGLKGGQPPSMHNLKESGSIENDADAILLLSHPTSDGEYQYQAFDEIWMRIAKNRSGPVTVWPTEGSSGLSLRWEPNITRFDPMDLAETEAQA